MASAITFIVATWEIPIGKLLITTLINLAVSYLFKDEMDDPSRGVKGNSRSTEENVPLVYGMQRVGGNVTMIDTRYKDNLVLFLVMTLSEGECESCENIYLDEKLITSFGASYTYWFQNGSSTQVVNSTIASWLDDLGYDDNNRNTAQLVLKLIYHEALYSSIPTVTVTLKGIKLYNFETGETEWSSNVVLALYDYMTNTRYGMGLSRLKFDLDSWIEAKDAIDDKGWEYNRVIKSMNADAIIEDMKKHGRLELVRRDGKYYLYHLDTTIETPCASIDDDYLLQDSNGVTQLKVEEPSRFSIPEGLRINWVNAAKDYVIEPLLLGEDTGGKVESMDLLGCTDIDTATEIGYYILERKQLSRFVTFTGKNDLINLEAGDLIELTSESLNITIPKEMRIETVNTTSQGLVTLKCIYETVNLYNKVYDPITDSIYNTNLLDRNTSPPNPIYDEDNPIITEETYTYKLKTYTRLFFDISFASGTYPNSWLDKLEVWVSLNLGETWKMEKVVDCDDFYIDPVEEGVTYYFTLVPVSIHGVKSDWEDALTLSYTVEGSVAVRPSSLTNLNITINSPNNVNLYSQKIIDPEVELYEFRLGQAWDTGIFLAALRSPNLSLSGVKPGSHTFMCNTLGTNGLYGENCVFATAEVFEPPTGWELNESWQYTDIDDFTDSSAEFYNTEINSAGNLVCSHSAIAYKYLDFYDDILVWTMDNPDSDDTIYDNYGNNSMSIVGIASWISESGISGGAFDYGGGYHLYVDAENAFGSSTASSLGLWFKPEENTDSSYLLYHNAFTLSIEIVNSKRYYCFALKAGGTWDEVYSVTQVVEDEYVHVGATYDGVTMKIFINGVLDNYETHSVGGNIDSVASTLLVSLSCYGVIDEFVYAKDTCLSTGQMAQLAELTILQGVYVSPIFNPAEITSQKILFYVDAVINTSSGDDNWDDIILFEDSLGLTPREIGLVSQSWLEILESTRGARVEMKLICSSSAPDSNWPDNASTYKYMEICSTIVEASYFQIQIKISDPSESISTEVSQLEFNYCEEV